MDFIVEKTNKDKEIIPLCQIYSQGDKIGIKFSDEGHKDRQKINYFLETYVKLERDAYEDEFSFTPSDGEL